ESNSIMRAVARLSRNDVPLYGRSAYEASRIDSFLDTSLVFARDAHFYLLALSDGSLDVPIYTRAKESFEIYAAGIERALAQNRESLVGDCISIADICFATEFALFMNERRRSGRLEKLGLGQILSPSVDTDYPRMMAHFQRILGHEHFNPDLRPYV